MKQKKRLLGILLSLALMLGLMPGMSLTALAYEDDPYASLVNTTTTVTFNGLEWYVIADNSTAVNAGTVTLLAKDPVGASKFHDSGNAYAGSTVASYLADLTTSGSFAGVADAIKTVQVDGVDAKLYLLSAEEANPISTAILKCNQADGASMNRWWLHTACPNNEVGFVGGDNGVIRPNASKSDGAPVTALYGVRPALQLDLSKIDFSAVRLTGGTNATASGGSLSQNSFGPASVMTEVTYTASNGYQFPAESEYYTATNGITVTRTSDTVVTVSGTPDGVANITVPDAKKPQVVTASDVTVSLGDEGKCVIGTTNGDGKITYAVKSGNAVTVEDNSGILTIRKEGTAVITVTAKETTTYFQGTKDVTVTVNAEQTQPGEEPWIGDPYDDLVNTTATIEFNGVAWYVIADNSTAKDAGTVTLFAKEPIDKQAFDAANSTYSSSGVKTYLDGLTTGSGSFAGVADAIKTVQVDAQDAKLYLLSADEATTIKSANALILKSSKASGAAQNYWWLRTSVSGSSNAVIFVDGDYGRVRTDGAPVTKEYGIRPALQLDLSKVTLSNVSVTLSGGANATTSGGGVSQKFFETDSSARSAMATVTYTAEKCSTFPETSDYYTFTDGITVERVDEKTVKVSGTPTADDVSVTIPDAIPNHDLHFSATDDTITAYCPTAGCPLRINKVPAVLIIDKPTVITNAQTGDGITAEAKLIGLDTFNTATGLSVSTKDIKYYKATKNGDAYTKGEALAAVPTEAGDYLAEITFSGVKTSESESGSVTASVGYTMDADNAVIAKISTIPAASDVKSTDRDAIEAARAAYDALTPEQKTQVGDELKEKLEATEAALAIAELPAANDVTTNNKAAIEAAREKYNNLSDDQKTQVGEAVKEKLEAAEAALEVASFDEGLSGITGISVDNKESVKALLDSYDKMTDEKKAAVDKKIGRAGTKKLADLEKALDITNKIETLDDVNDIDVSDEKAISFARTAYELLSDSQKQMIPQATVQKLEAAEAKITQLKEQSVLVAAKTSAIDRLNDYADAKAKADATDDEKTAYNNAVAAEIEKINAAANKDAVATALTNAKKAVDAALAKIEKDRADEAAAAQEMAEADQALADAKTSADTAKKAADTAKADQYASQDDKNAIDAKKSAVDTAVNAANALPANATAADKNAAAQVIVSAVNELNAVTDTANVHSAAAKAQAEEQATAAQQLAAAKTSAIDRLNDYADAKALANATDAEKTSYNNAVAKEIEKINAASDKDTVATALTNAKKAVDAALAKIEKDRADAAAAAQEMAEADQSLADAKTTADTAKKAADTAKADQYASQDDKSAIDTKKSAVDTAVSTANALDEKATAEQKNAAAKAIEDAVKALDEAVDTANIHSASTKAQAEEQAAAAQQLAAAKAYAIERLEDYSEAKALTDATATEKAAHNKVVADGKAAINAAADKDAVATALTNAKRNVDASITKIENDRVTAAVEKAKAKKVVIKSAKAKKGKKALVKWKKLSGISGYQVVYSTSKKFTKKTTKKVYVNKWTTRTLLENLKAGKRYYVKVRSYNNISNPSKHTTKTIYGKYSKVKRFRAEK